MPGIKLTQEGGEIKFKKTDFDFASQPGPPIAGWISNKRVGIWLNHLRGLENEFFDIRERKDINKEHITLYEGNKLIGWVDKSFKGEVEDLLWDYLKNGKPAKEEKEVNEAGQLALF